MILVVAQSVVLSWLYNSTRASLPLVIISHATIDTVARFVLPQFTGSDYQLIWWCQAALWTGLALLVAVTTQSTLNAAQPHRTRVGSEATAAPMPGRHVLQPSPTLIRLSVVDSDSSAPRQRQAAASQYHPAGAATTSLRQRRTMEDIDEGADSTRFVHWPAAAGGCPARGGVIDDQPPPGAGQTASHRSTDDAAPEQRRPAGRDRAGGSRARRRSESSVRPHLLPPMAIRRSTWPPSTGWSATGWRRRPSRVPRSPSREEPRSSTSAATGTTPPAPRSPRTAASGSRP